MRLQSLRIQITHQYRNKRITPISFPRHDVMDKWELHFEGMFGFVLGFCKRVEGVGFVECLHDGCVERDGAEGGCVVREGGDGAAAEGEMVAGSGIKC